MENKILENIIYVLFGILIQLILFFKLIELPEFFIIIVGFVGFAAIVYGFLELFSVMMEKRTKKPVIMENKPQHINFCVNCGEEISFGNRYCPECGKHIRDE
jgi:hypothetical protein